MSDTVHLARIQTASGTSQSGKQWTRWDFLDDQGQKIGSTFVAAIGNAAQAHIGGLVDVEREHDGRGYKVSAVRPASTAPVVPQQQPAPAPVQRTGAEQGNGGQQYYRPRDPRESRSIIRQVAVKAAAELVAAKGGGAEDLFALAGRIETWVARPIDDSAGVGGADDSVPF